MRRSPSVVRPPPQSPGSRGWLALSTRRAARAFGACPGPLAGEASPPVLHPALTLFAVLFLGFASVGYAADLRVMKTGLGKGWIQGPGISCGITSTDPATDTDTIGTACNTTATGTITLTAREHLGSSFAGWGGDCGTVPVTTLTCDVTLDAMRSVRADFTLDTPVPPLTDLTPTGINTYLSTVGASVNTQAEFVAALPREFRQNWMHMTRSESLQTGIGAFPRILLVSEDAEKAFTLGLDEHSSYPGSHPNAIEYMQWDPDPTQRNFRFHEIVLSPIDGMDAIDTTVEPCPDPTIVPPDTCYRFPERPTRQLTADDRKCFACHSTRNVLNDGSTPGTTGIPIGTVKHKTKPNWDTYDSWAGMLAFNRDRIYKGSIEAATFRQLMNLWTWQTDEAVRSVIEQLELQPPWITDTVRPQDRITRWDTAGTEGGANDGHIRFDFDPPYPTVEPEPIPTAVTTTPPGGATVTVDYTFERSTPNATPSTIARNNDFVVLQHSNTGTGPRFGTDEGRGTNFFNNLYVELNPRRIVDEMSPIAPETNIFATGSVPIDVRPIALAIANDCITVTNGSAAVTQTQSIAGVTDADALDFFEDRNGMDFDALFDDTHARAASISRRKADIQKLNLDRTGDVYVYSSGPDAAVGLIDMHLSRTDGLVPTTDPGLPGTAASLRRRQLRQEVFRRPTSGVAELDSGGGASDRTAMGGIYVEREQFSVNTQNIALYRFFLEPLGVSVDNAGGAGPAPTRDQFTIDGSYDQVFRSELSASLGVSACSDIMPLVAAEFLRLPDPEDPPPYTDVQRIFNKACIECHGGLNYPPVRNYPWANFNLAEDEKPAPGQRRLWRPLSQARTLVGAPACPPGDVTCPTLVASDPSTSYLYQRITDYGDLQHPYDPGDIAGSDEDCPNGLMPCGGPPLSKTDIRTIGRWIVGGAPNTEGDPHIRTVDGVNYDFQSAGEFVLLRDPGLELQARQSAVTTAGPLGPNAHTGLSSCVSVNTAVALRAGDHRITYQPDLSPRDDVGVQSPRLQLRVDGKPVALGEDPIPLGRGGRIVPTNSEGGLEVQLAGGTRVAVTPSFWQRHQVHFMHVNVYHGRAVDGVMGAIAPNNWLPRLSNGDFLGPRPASLADRYRDLYETFADSWRVDATTSLFHYEPGLGPESFLVPGWPVAEAQGCHAPPQPGVPVPTAPVTPIGRPQAEQHCAGLVDPDRRENCVQDVMATGDPIFAEAYGQSQNLDQRILIAPANLVSPADNAEVATGQVDFEWSPVPGTEDVDVTHYHCLWSSAERFDFNDCTVLGSDGGPLDAFLPPALEQHSLVVCVVLVVLLLLIALVLFLKNRRRAALFVLLLALVLAVICWLHASSATEPTGVRIDGLMGGESYRWKVVTETRDGLISESETRRFELQE